MQYEFRQRAPVPPADLPQEAVNVVDELDEAELRAIIDYAQARKRFVHPHVTDQIEAKEGEELLRVEERNGYTEVVKSQRCADGCSECPHGPYLYHVREERRPERNPSPLDVSRQAPRVKNHIRTRLHP